MMRGFGGFRQFDNYGMMGNFGWIGELVFLIVIVLIIVGIVLFIKTLVQQTHKASFTNTSNRNLEILNERYAKGEITKDEYETIKKSL